MNVDLDGMLNNARLALEAFDVLADDDLVLGEYQPKLCAFSLGELQKHLREMRDRWKAGDIGVVDEFFALYVLDEPKLANRTFRPVETYTCPIHAIAMTKISDGVPSGWKCSKCADIFTKEAK